MTFTCDHCLRLFAARSVGLSYDEGALCRECAAQWEADKEAAWLSFIRGLVEVGS